MASKDMKTAIITGASSGIGSEIVEALEQKDWNVIGPYHLELDLSNLRSVKDYAEKIRQNTSRIDALIHVAGIWHDDDSILANKQLQEFTSDEIANTINVGLTSFIILAAKLLTNIPKDGAVVAISGTFSDGAAGWVPYYTSKRALEDFIVGLAQDYPKGPNIFGISPADTATQAYKKFYPEYAKGAQSPKDVANFFIKLINNDTNYKSGDIIAIRNCKVGEGYHT